MSDLVQDLINKRGDTTPPRQAIMKTYILQFIYRDGNGWAFVNATTPNQAEKIFKNQTRYVDARVTAIKETKWYGDSMQVVFEGAVTTYQNVNVSISLEDIINSSDAYSSVEEYIKSILGDLYYTAEEIDNKLANLNVDIDLSEYATKSYVENKINAIEIPSIEIKNDYWYINNTYTGVKAKGEDGQTPTISISTDGYWVINDVKTEYKATGEGGGIVRFEDLTQEQIEQLKGVGINNMVAQYALSTSNTSAPTSTWSTTVKTPNASQKYLWAKFVVTFTDNTSKTLGPFVLGNYAKDGADGTGGGGSAVSPEEYWKGKKYIACGDSITDSTIATLYTNKYCNKVATALNMNITNIGISGSTMFQTTSSVLNGSAAQGRSFIYELMVGNSAESAYLDPNDAHTNDCENNNHLGPTGINWQNYDLITLMLGTNDSLYLSSNIGKFVSSSYAQDLARTYPDYPNGFDTTRRNIFSQAYEEAILKILHEKRSDATLVICIPPKSTSEGFNVDRKSQTYNVSVKDIIEQLAAKYELPVIDFFESNNIALLDGVHPSNAGHEEMANIMKARLLEIAREKTSGGYGSGVNVAVVDSEEEAIEDNTIYFFDNSLLQGVGLYNILLQQGTVNGKDGKLYRYHPGNLYRLYDDGSFDEINKQDVQITFSDNKVYYNGVRTTMLRYGEIFVPNTIRFANTSDTAYFSFRVTGPFYENTTPVTLTYDENDLEILEVTGVTEISETASWTNKGITRINAGVEESNPVPRGIGASDHGSEVIKYLSPTTRIISSGYTYNFTYDNFTEVKKLFVKRKYTNLQELEQSKTCTVTFSTPTEEQEIKFLYGKTDLIYKGGETNPTNPMNQENQDFIFDISYKEALHTTNGVVDGYADWYNGNKFLFPMILNSTDISNHIWALGTHKIMLRKDYQIDRTKYNVLYVVYSAFLNTSRNKSLIDTNGSERLVAHRYMVTGQGAKKQWESSEESTKHNRFFTGPDYDVTIFPQKGSEWGSMVKNCILQEVRLENRPNNDGFSTDDIIELSRLVWDNSNNAGTFCIKEIGILTFDDLENTEFIDDDYK